jgi:hypothetical protein
VCGVSRCTGDLQGHGQPAPSPRSGRSHRSWPHRRPCLRLPGRVQPRGCADHRLHRELPEPNTPSSAAAEEPRVFRPSRRSSCVRPAKAGGCHCVTGWSSAPLQRVRPQPVTSDHARVRRWRQSPPSAILRPRIRLMRRNCSHDRSGALRASVPWPIPSRQRFPDPAERRPYDLVRASEWIGERCHAVSMVRRRRESPRSMGGRRQRGKRNRGAPGVRSLSCARSLASVALSRSITGSGTRSPPMTHHPPPAGQG